MRMLSLLLSLLPLVAACSTLSTPGEDARAALPESDLRFAEAEQAANGYAETEVYYHILAGELAGKLKQFPKAAEFYAAAAAATADPRVAKRATKIALYAKDAEHAMAAAQRWAALQPDEIEAHLILSQLLVATDQPKAAVPHLQVMIEAADDQRVYGLVAKQLGKTQDREQALQALELLAERNAEDPYAYLVLAGVALEYERYERALQAAERGLQLAPDNQDLHVLKAQALLRSGQQQAAIAALEQLVDSQSVTAEVRLAYVQMLVKAGRYAAAQPELETLVAANPEDTELLRQLGLLALETERYAPAVERFQELASSAEHASLAYYFLGRIRQAQGRVNQAIEHYRQVTAEPYWLNARIRMANMHVEQGRLDQGRQVYVNLREQVTEQALQKEIYLAEGQMLVDRQRYQAALSLYDRALESFAADTDLLYARALAAAAVGRVAWLERDLRRILADDPDHVMALNALGYTLADQTQRYQEALGYIEQAYAAQPDDPAIIDSMGWVHYRLGQLDKAEDYLREAYALAKDNEIASHLVEVLWHRGAKAEARSLLQDELANSPDDPYLTQVKQRLGLE